jgi:type I restriction enzyme R subunit
MKNNDRQTARVEHDAALKRAVTGLVADHTELFKQFVDNPQFSRWLADMVFHATYRPPGAPPGLSP